jgi:hypothetical protein
VINIKDARGKPSPFGYPFLHLPVGESANVVSTVFYPARLLEKKSISSTCTMFSFRSYYDKEYDEVRRGNIVVLRYLLFNIDTSLLSALLGSYFVFMDRNGEYPGDWLMVPFLSIRFSRFPFQARTIAASLLALWDYSGVGNIVASQYLSNKVRQQDLG